ncbi:MAG TPA: gephyrin-like molybdotransferase Glp [Acidimicrobiia bacterium]|nr:gephyrin-like molybdotransferase Glp [Acidimicrobiia bacterium]
MIPLAEAQGRVFSGIETLPPRRIAVVDALGLVLAADVVASEPIPPFANTAMDGYAVRAADTASAAAGSPARLRVVGTLAAGAAPTTAVGAGEAIRIMTGAPIPDGADAVVMVERTTRDDGADRADADDRADDFVLVHEAAAVGDHVRPAGGDLAVGELVFEAGTVLGPAHLGVLASIDVQELSVHPRPRVGVISTGDELVAAGPVGPGQIRDSNRPMLLALVTRAGFDAVDLGIARDDEAGMTAAIGDALDRCDALITSGGVSVGDFDFVSNALERLAAHDADPRARVDWYQIAIRPAKPLCFSFVRGRPVFGLPGNPVSSLVSFEVFARPALLTLAGRRDTAPRVVRATAEEAMPRKVDGKLHLDRVALRLVDGRYLASGVRAQASNALAATAAAHGLALVPDGDGVAAGDEVMVQLLD